MDTAWTFNMTWFTLVCQVLQPKSPFHVTSLTLCVWVSSSHFVIFWPTSCSQQGQNLAPFFVSLPHICFCWPHMQSSSLFHENVTFICQSFYQRILCFCLKGIIIWMDGWLWTWGSNSWSQDVKFWWLWWSLTFLLVPPWQWHLIFRVFEQVSTQWLYFFNFVS